MDNIKPYLKILLPLLFILAVLLGLSRQDAFQLFGQNESSFTRPLTESASRLDDSLESFYNSAKDLAGGNNNPTSATFVATGDIMLSRDVAAQIDKTKNSALPFQNVSQLLTSADFNFGNLESPFSGSDKYMFSNQFVFNSPRFALDGLKQYFKIVATANNHAYDQEKAGIDYTLSALAKSGITTVGTGNTPDEAWTGKVIEANGIKIGFIGASYTPSNNGKPNSNVALISDTKRLSASLSELRRRADFIVVAMHAGEEYTRTPTKQQTDFARAAVDNGADMVIGAHPHWIQPIEQYKGRYIFYSLGNFVFDQGFSQETKEGLALKITINRIAGGVQLKQVELNPVVIDHYCCARPATDAETQSILKKINQTNNILYP